MMKYLMLIALLIPFPAEGKRLKHEDAYNREWCASVGGKAEVVNLDKSRTDCLTLGYAIETDFVDKFYEAIGQSVHYSRMQERLPGIYLVLETEADCERLVNAMITIWRIGVKFGAVGVVPIRVWSNAEDVCKSGTGV